MTSLLAHWPIARRVVLGLSLLGLCLLAASGTGWWAMSSVAAAFGDYSKAAAEVEAADLLRVRTAEFVGGAKEYAARNTESRYAETLELYERVVEAKDAARAVAPDPAFQAAVDDTARTLEALQNTFEAMAVARVERNRIVSDELRAPGTRARAALSQARETADPATRSQLGDASVHLLLARDYMNRFLDDFTPREYARSNEEIELARSTLAAVGGAPASIDSDLAQFDAGLTALNAALAVERAEVAAFFDERLPEAEAGILNMIDIAHAAEARAEDALAATKTAAFWLIGATLVVAGVLGVAVSFALSRSIVSPVRALTAAMGRLADGDLGIEAPGADRRDELGDMARALAVLKANSEERVRLEEQRLADAQAQRHHQDAVDQQVAMFGKSIEGVMGRFNASSTHMGELAVSMDEASSDTHAKAQSVAEAMARAEAAIQTIASATQEMTGSVSEIGEQAGRAAQMSKSVRASAEGAGRDVADLAAAVAEISKVVDLINEIAEQTNLLALNATIESARAGEAGKGFAVVASEVKALASQTAKATEEIARSLAGVDKVSGAARSAMEGIQSAIADLDEVAETVASAAEEQRAATEEIARSASSLSEEASTIGEDVVRVREAGGAAKEASTEVSTMADAIGGEADVLSEEVRSFLEGIGDSKVRSVIVPTEVEMPASVTIKAGTVADVVVMRLSPAYLELDRAVNAAQGERVKVSLPDGETVEARLADTSERRTRLQLSMERAKLDAMERYMAKTAVRYWRAPGETKEAGSARAA
jgi:methyl-accepting chemotaxis protein